MRKALTIFLGVYALILVLLIPSKGLWMDEIIDLNGVRGASDVKQSPANEAGDTDRVTHAFGQAP